MSGPQYYGPMPTAGQYPAYGPQQPESYPPPRYRNDYAPQQYSPPPQQSFQPNPPYPMQYPPYPQQFPGEGPPYQAPNQANGLRSQPSGQTWDPKAIWAEHNSVPDYNNPPEPMYGKPQGAPEEFAHHERSETANIGQPGADGERGLGATVLGGGAGAFLGHKLGGKHGTLGTIGGLAVGAIAANALEHHEKEKKRERRDEREYDEGYEHGERRGSRSRDIDDSYYQDDQDRDYEDDDYYRPHHHHHHHHDRDDDDDYRDQYRDDYRDDYNNDYRDGYYERY